MGEGLRTTALILSIVFKYLYYLPPPRIRAWQENPASYKQHPQCLDHATRPTLPRQAAQGITEHSHTEHHLCEGTQYA